MKIAYVCADRGIPLLGTKGASVHVREITSALAARGHEVHVLCAEIGNGNPSPNVASIAHCAGAADLEEALRERARDGGVDVVLERYSLESGIARRTSHLLGVPLVLEVNAPLVLEAARWRGLSDVPNHLTNERHTFSTADAVIVVSRGLAHYVAQSAPHTPTYWVPNGAAIDNSSAAISSVSSRVHSEVGPVVVGFTGSMKRWHGLHELLDAFKRVRPRHSNSVLVLAGNGPEEEPLRARVRSDSTLRDCVWFAGAVPHHDIPALLTTFDVGVAPYLPTNDFYFSPLKVVEYLAAGLPVVHPRLGDLCDIVLDAGITYDADDHDGLADALQRALGDATLRRRCGIAARSRAPEFTWDATAAKVEHIFERATREYGLETLA